MVKGREVIADGDDHHNQPHSILFCVCDCDDDHWSHKPHLGSKVCVVFVIVFVIVFMIVFVIVFVFMIVFVDVFVIVYAFVIVLVFVFVLAFLFVIAMMMMMTATILILEQCVFLGKSRSQWE